MIELENLNNRSLEDILDESKKQIMYLSTEWTDFQESDPGITLIELFSWLKFVQHEYLNRQLPGVKIKFLRLLDVAIHKNKGSEAFLEVSNVDRDVNVPVRTKWESTNMVFENIHHQTLMKSKILSVSFENPEFPSEEDYYKIDGSKIFYLFGKDISRKNDETAVRRFTINFDSELPENSVINLYFSVHTSSGLKRNSIRPVDKFEPMAEVKWEYYGAENGKTGWFEAEIIKDNTYNFLFSGVIKMNFGGKSVPFKGEYKIRATLIYDEYDYPPRIDKILTNVFRVCQNDTKCENTVIKKEEVSDNHTFKVRSYMAIYGESDVYYKKHNGWVKTDVPTFKPDINQGELNVNVGEVWKQVRDFSDDEEVFMVVSYDKKIENKLCLGSGTGISAQTAEINAKDILMDGFEIMISENIDGEEVFYKWDSVRDFFSSGKYDRHYVIEKEADLIIFGDHDHGMAPRKGSDNIKICSLRYTSGGDSNTKEGMITKVCSKNKILKNAGIAQITPATGGMDAETLDHAEARAADIFSTPERAVTARDFKNIVKRTPGLMFTNVKILPGYMPGEDISTQNCVTVAVRWNKKVGLTLPKSFEKNIMNQIDKYRLINMKVKVVSPEYIGLIIGGDITVDSFYRESDGLIEKEIENFIEEINSELGQTLHFGDLFGMIDRLKYVSQLEKLRITPTGNYVQKNVSEDVIIPPNGVYYIKKIDFNYIRSSEIYSS